MSPQGVAPIVGIAIGPGSGIGSNAPVATPAGGLPAQPRTLADPDPAPAEHLLSPSGVRQGLVLNGTMESGRGTRVQAGLATATTPRHLTLRPATNPGTRVDSGRNDESPSPHGGI